MSTIRSSLGLAVLLPVLTAVAAAQTTWYVDASVPGPGTGTPQDPFPLITPALQASAHGDEIRVAAGVYHETISTSRQVRVIATDGPLLTVIQPVGAPLHTFRSFGCCLGTFLLEGFTIYGSVRAEDGVVRRCILIGGGEGVGLMTGNEIWAERCTIHGFQIGAGSALHGAFIRTRDTLFDGNNIDVAENFWHAYTWWRTWSAGGIVLSGLGEPGLVYAAGHDYHLAPGSPCIDAGDPASPPDPDGSRADIGALPFDPAYAPFTTYCTSKTNSLGCVPAIGASHNASVSSSRPFWITCTQQLNQHFGLLLYGFAPKNSPYQGGYLCIQAPMRRSELLDSGGNFGTDDCSGEFAYDFNQRIDSGVDPALTVGVEVVAQYWSRDPAASFSSNRSDAVRFKILP